MVSLTGVLDKPLQYFATKTGIPISEYAPQVGGELIGTSLEQVSDIFTKGWFNLLMKVGTGALAGGYAVWGNPSKRLTRELIPIANHLMMRVLELRPNDFTDLFNSINQTQMALAKNDMNAVVASMVRSPRELQVLMSSLGVPLSPADLLPFGRVGSPGSPSPVTAQSGNPRTAGGPGIAVEPPIFRGQGRYQVTALT